MKFQVQESHHLSGTNAKINTSLKLNSYHWLKRECIESKKQINCNARRRKIKNNTQLCNVRVHMWQPCAWQPCADVDVVIFSSQWFVLHILRLYNLLVIPAFKGIFNSQIYICICKFGI